MRVRLLHKINSQAGVTLFLSILVLSAITAIAFSVASITFIEIATSGDVQRTEPSYYSDQGITEEAIYSLKRRVNGTTGVPNPAPIPPFPLYFGEMCAALFVPYASPSTVVRSDTKICDIAAQHNIEVRVLPSAGSFGAARRFYLYNPLNYGIGAGGYGSVTVSNVSTTNVTIHVYICKLNLDCISGDPWTADVDVSPNTIRTFPLQGATDSYELAITNLSVAQLGTAQDAFVQLATFDTGGAPKGLPYLNKKSVEIQSTRSGTTRRVQVLVPTQ